MVKVKMKMNMPINLPFHPRRSKVEFLFLTSRLISLLSETSCLRHRPGLERYPGRQEAAGHQVVLNLVRAVLRLDWNGKTPDVAKQGTVEASRGFQKRPLPYEEESPDAYGGVADDQLPGSGRGVGRWADLQGCGFGGDQPGCLVLWVLGHGCVSVRFVCLDIKARDCGLAAVQCGRKERNRDSKRAAIVTPCVMPARGLVLPLARHSLSAGSRECCASVDLQVLRGGGSLLTLTPGTLIVRQRDNNQRTDGNQAPTPEIGSIKPALA